MRIKSTPATLPEPTAHALQRLLFKQGRRDDDLAALLDRYCLLSVDYQPLNENVRAWIHRMCSIDAGSWSSELQTVMLSAAAKPQLRDGFLFKERHQSGDVRLWLFALGGELVFVTPPWFSVEGSDE